MASGSGLGDGVWGAFPGRTSSTSHPEEKPTVPLHVEGWTLGGPEGGRGLLLIHEKVVWLGLETRSLQASCHLPPRQLPLSGWTQSHEVPCCLPLTHSLWMPGGSLERKTNAGFLSPPSLGTPAQSQPLPGAGGLPFSFDAVDETARGGALGAACTAPAGANADVAPGFEARVRSSGALCMKSPRQVSPRQETKQPELVLLHPCCCWSQEYQPLNEHLIPANWMQ